MNRMELNELESQSLPTLSGTSNRWNRTAGAGGVSNAPAAVFPSTGTGNNTTADAWEQQQQQQTYTQVPTNAYLVGTESLEDRVKRDEERLFDQVVELEQTARDTESRADAMVEEQDAWMTEPIGTPNLRGSSNFSLLLSSSVIHAHLQVVQQTMDPRNATSSNALLETVRAFENVVTSNTSNNSNASTTAGGLGGPAASAAASAATNDKNAGYALAWKLVEELVAPQLPRRTVPMEQARGIVRHLCHQFRQHLVDTVRRYNRAVQGAGDSSSTAAGTDSMVRYRSDMANKAAQYCAVTLGDLNTSVWPAVYYCLRCGDAVAAQEVLRTTNSPQELNPAVLRLLQAWVAKQGQAPNVWEDDDDGNGHNSFPPLAMNDRRAAADLVATELPTATTTASTMGQQSDRPKIHQIGTYALLSGLVVLPSDAQVLGFNTIEDYLTGGLWNALLSDNLCDAVVKQAELFLQFGPSHFDADMESGGWSFVWPLLLTQQYEKALSYLLETAGPLGLLQAAHLGLVLANAGIALCNLGDDDLSGQSSLTFSASLLTIYANYLMTVPSAGPAAALEYLVRIPNKVRACKEVATLIATTGQLEQLVGVVNAEGIRQGAGSALDKYFSAAEISALLADAAQQLLRVRGDRQRAAAAVMCYMLAGRYADVLNLLNQFLSPPNQPDDDRLFWLEQTQSFHGHYLDKRTHVVETLERDGKVSLTTSRTMLALNSFFALLRDGRTDDASKVADGLGLLPSFQSDLTTKEIEYQALDVLVKDAMPSLIEGVVKCLHVEHRRLKLQVTSSNSSGIDSSSSGGVVRERLRQIQEQVQLLVTYAGLVGMASEQIHRLSRMEALMI